MSATKVDLADKATFLAGQPHEYFKRLRREEPVSWQDHQSEDGDGFWILTKYDDIVDVERDPALFSSALGGTMIEPLGGGAELMMLNQDPPRHTRLKLLVSRMFTPRHIRSIEDSVRAAAKDIVERVAPKGEIDLVTEVSADLPLVVIAELLGVPQEDRHKVFEWSNQMVGADDPEYGGMTTPMEASAELFAYAQSLADKRMADPGEDIVTLLLTGEVDGEKLDPMEFNLFFMLLAVAGNETTRNLITGGVLALLDHPDERDRLCADPSLIPTAVEEMLRYVSPVNYFRRTTTRDTEIRGVKIKQGEKVTLWYPSANRDEDHFPDPDRFDVGRTPNEHLAFGARGPHFCLGANLARFEITCMFEELVRTILPEMEQNGPVDRLKMNLIAGIKHLPVKFPPAEG